LYLTDFDPNGNGMPVDMSNKILHKQESGELTQDIFLEPIAITLEIAKGLPGIPIEIKEQQTRGKIAYETRKKKFLQKSKVYVELSALESKPDLYEKIISDAVSSWSVDAYDIINASNEVKQQIKQQIEREIRKQLTDENIKLLKDWFDETIELVGEVESLLPDPEPIEEKYKEAIDKANEDSNRIQEISDKLNEIVENIDLPEVEPPKIFKDVPWDNIFFDTRRDKNEQIRILKKYKDTGEWS